jgi:hypothetical protein
VARVSGTDKGVAPHYATAVDGSFETANYLIFLVAVQIYCITFGQDGLTNLAAFGPSILSSLIVQVHD